MLLLIDDVHLCEDIDVTAISKTSPRATHVDPTGDLVPAGNVLVTPDLYYRLY